jgi:hypothetical protein
VIEADSELPSDTDAERADRESTISPTTTKQQSPKTNERRRLLRRRCNTRVAIRGIPKDARSRIFGKQAGIPEEIRTPRPIFGN